MTDLLDAIDALTKPEIAHVAQKADDGTWLKAHTVTQESLLTRLEAAIHSSMGDKSAGGSNPATRAVLDSDALFRSLKIRGMVTDWCRIANVEPDRNDTSVSLRRWYVAWTVTSERDDSWHTGKLRAWEGTIRGLLDPPRRIPLTAACTICGKAEYVNEDGDMVPYPLVVEYQDHDPDILGSARAICRACEFVWRGSGALRALRYDIDQAEAS